MQSVCVCGPAPGSTPSANKGGGGGEVKEEKKMGKEEGVMEWSGK